MKVSISSLAVTFILALLLYVPCNNGNLDKVDVDGKLDDEEIDAMDRQGEKLSDMLSQLEGLGDTLQGSLKHMGDMNFFQTGEGPDRLTEEQIKELERLDELIGFDDDAFERSESKDSSERSENKDSSEKSEHKDSSEKSEHKDASEKSESEDASEKNESEDASTKMHGKSEKGNDQIPPYKLGETYNGGGDTRRASLKDMPNAKMSQMNFFQAGEGPDRLTEEQIKELEKLDELTDFDDDAFERSESKDSSEKGERKDSSEKSEHKDTLEKSESEDASTKRHGKSEKSNDQIPPYKLGETYNGDKQFDGSDNSGRSEDSDRNEKLAHTVNDVKKERSTQTCNSVVDGVCSDNPQQYLIPNILRKEGESDPIPNILRKEGESEPIPNILKEGG